MNRPQRIAALLATLALPGTLAAQEAASDDDSYRQAIDQLLDDYEREPSPEPEKDYVHVPLAIDFVPGLGMSAFGGERQVRHISANIIGGRAAGLHGIEGAGVFNIEHDFVHGVQGAGVINLDGGTLQGVQGAGAVNRVAGDAHGVQGAGAVNIANGAMQGVQGAGAGNIASGPLRGVQASGAFNLALGEVNGVQASGGINIAGEDVSGLQAGVVNIASGKVHGLQVGLVNYAEDIDGFALGLVNIYPEGRLHADVWIDETGQLSQGLKHGGSWFHSIWALGFNPFYPRDISATLGMGLHRPLTPHLFADLDGLYRYVKLSDVPWGTLHVQGSLRAVLGLQLSERLALLAGPSYTVLTTRCGPPEGRGVRVLDDMGQVTSYGWPGFVLGLQLL